MRFISSIVLTLSLAPATLGQHAGDVLLTIENGRFATSLIDPESGVITPNVRAFGAEFGEFEANFTNEPGFDSEPGAFPVPGAIGFTVRRALRLWDGAAFASIPISHIDIAFSELGPITAPSCDTAVTGFSLPVGSNGEWHRHLEYTLAAPADAGVYLLEIELFSSDPGIGTSRPFWLIFNQNSEPSHAAAIEWVELNLVPRLCDADLDAGGDVGVPDIFAFLGWWFAGSADAEFDGSCGIGVPDIFAFLSEWFSSC